MTNKSIIKKLAKNCESCVTKPCQLGCPLNNDITEFIKFIKEEKYEDAYRVLSNTTIMPSLCGRVCPHFKQCQGKCVKGVSYKSVEIGKLEAFIGDLALEQNWKITSPKKTKHKVAIIGGGPAGVTCAAFLRRKGIGVTIYEKKDYLGGLLVHGIPDFRLPKKLVKDVMDRIVDLGIKVKYNQELGKDFNIKDLEREYDAIFLAIGANISSHMNIPGEELEGVIGGNELLEYDIPLDYKNKTIVVSGGGNTAMDVARFVKRKGAKRVIVVYRRSEEEMPAEKIEVAEAKDEGIEFIFQNNILKIIGDKRLEKIELIKTELVKKESESRLSPVNIEGTNYYIDCDYVVMAIGSHSDNKIIDSLDLKLNSKGKIDIDSFGRTSNEFIFSGGDVAETISTVAWASRAGRNAAIGIMNYLRGEINNE